MVFTFPSTHLAMTAEDALRESGLPIQVIPTPPGHGAVCGLAISMEAAHAERAQSVLRDCSIAWSEVFHHRPPRRVH
jgi:hypothetical protein